MSKLIAIITLTALVAVSNGRPTVPQTFPLVETVDNKPKTLPLVVPIEPKVQTFPLFEKVGSESVPKTFPVVEPVNPTKVVPKTFPLELPVDSKVRTLPLVVPVQQKPQTFPSFENVGPKSMSLNIPTDSNQKNLPVMVPVDRIGQDFPLFEGVGQTSVPKTFPLVEPVNTKAKTLPLVVPVEQKPQTFPSYETIQSKPLSLNIPTDSNQKNLPVIVPVDTIGNDLPLFQGVESTSVPKTFPLVEPVNQKAKTLPLIVPAKGKQQTYPLFETVNSKVYNSEEYNPKNLPVVIPVNSIGDKLPIFKDMPATDIPKTFPLVEPVNPKQKTLPLLVPVEQKPQTFPSYQTIDSVPKTFPLVQPVEPKLKTLPLVIPVKNVPQTFPAYEKVNTQSKNLPLITPVKAQLSTFPLLTPVQLSDANNQLGLSLVKNLNEDKKNVFISPFSLSTALAMLFSGAKGTTAQQMREVLGYNMVNMMDSQVFEQYHEILENLKTIQKKNNENSLNVANKIVVQKNFDILSSFEDNLKQNFESSVDIVDFKDNKTPEKINEWVSKQTNDKIKKLIDGPMDPNTKMVLLNAIYFKGVFQTKFDEKKTREEVFFTDDNQQKTIEMMIRKGEFNYTVIPELDSTMIEIPYTGHDFSLYVLLPNERQGLKKLNNEINDWSLIEKSIDNKDKRTVDVALPKFKIETSYKLKNTLSSMGMSAVFSPSSDLSGIDGSQDLEVSEVVHKAFVEVNEEGTEAAGATAIEINSRASIDDPMIPVFRADHPFIFFIRDNVNRMNLFLGQVNQL